MKRITCVFAAILLLVFVVRGVILPIVNRVGGGSSKDTETVNDRRIQQELPQMEVRRMHLHRLIRLHRIHPVTAVQMLW